jgi:hypothetical protein
MYHNNKKKNQTQGKTNVKVTWNATNLNGDSGWKIPLLIHLSGRNSSAFSPQMDDIRPIA